MRGDILITEHVKDVVVTKLCMVMMAGVTMIDGKINLNFNAMKETYQKIEKIKAVVKYYKCGEHKKLLKLLDEISCHCFCHGGEFINDCHYIGKDICEGCGLPSTPSP